MCTAARQACPEHSRRDAYVPSANILILVLSPLSLGPVLRPHLSWTDRPLVLWPRDKGYRVQD